MSIETVKIKPGQIFEVESKMYMIVLPTKATREVNAHGQILFALQEIEA